MPTGALTSDTRPLTSCCCLRPTFLALVALLGAAGTLHADMEQAPIYYSKTTPDNRIRALQDRMNKGLAKLAFDDDHGYLKALLAELHVPPSAQMLVFS